MYSAFSVAHTNIFLFLANLVLSLPQIRKLRVWVK